MCPLAFLCLVLYALIGPGCLGIFIGLRLGVFVGCCRLSVFICLRGLAVFVGFVLGNALLFGSLILDILIFVRGFVYIVRLFAFEFGNNGIGALYVFFFDPVVGICRTRNLILFKRLLRNAYPLSVAFGNNCLEHACRFGLKLDFYLSFFGIDNRRVK